MKAFSEAMIIICAAVPWLMGMVLAKGFWLTTLAIFFPPYAWYLVTEKALIVMGWVI